MNKRDMLPPCCPGETWAPVPGWEGFYEVSTCGRVWSVDRRQTDGKRGGNKLVGKNFVGDGTRRQIRLVEGQREFHATKQRLVLITFVGPRPNGCHAFAEGGDPHLKNCRWAEHREAHGYPL